MSKKNVEIKDLEFNHKLLQESLSTLMKKEKMAKNVLSQDILSKF